MIVNKQYILINSGLGVNTSTTPATNNMYRSAGNLYIGAASAAATSGGNTTIVGYLNGKAFNSATVLTQPIKITDTTAKLYPSVAETAAALTLTIGTVVANTNYQFTLTQQFPTGSTVTQTFVINSLGSTSAAALGANIVIMVNKALQFQQVASGTSTVTFTSNAGYPLLTLSGVSSVFTAGGTAGVAAQGNYAQLYTQMGYPVTSGATYDRYVFTTPQVQNDGTESIMETTLIVNEADANEAAFVTLIAVVISGALLTGTTVNAVGTAAPQSLAMA